ncbi:MAG: cyclic-di-AMP receptor [Erysipelotrichaceae bacterium]|nr:cyclic-di-AMP receptor [Erysipelotrichaceae bacterium]
MKLIIAIVSNDDSANVSSSLIKEGFSVTKLATTGGFLRAGNTTLIIGLDDEKVDEAIEIIRKDSKRRTEVVSTPMSYDLGKNVSFPIEVEVGGAVIFVVDVDKFIRV